MKILNGSGIIWYRHQTWSNYKPYVIEFDCDYFSTSDYNYDYFSTYDHNYDYSNLVE